MHHIVIFFSKIKLSLFSHFSVILTIVKNEWPQLTAKIQFSIILRNTISESK